MLLPKRGTSRSTENTSDRIVTSFLTGIKKKKKKKKKQSNDYNKRDGRSFDKDIKRQCTN